MKVSATWQSSSSSSGWKMREIKQNSNILKKWLSMKTGILHLVSHTSVSLFFKTLSVFFKLPNGRQVDNSLSVPWLSPDRMAEWCRQLFNAFVSTLPLLHSTLSLPPHFVVSLWRFFHCLSCQSSFEWHEFDYRTNKVFLFACWQ